MPSTSESRREWWERRRGAFSAAVLAGYAVAVVLYETATPWWAGDHIGLSGPSLVLGYGPGGLVLLAFANALFSVPTPVRARRPSAVIAVFLALWGWDTWSSACAEAKRQAHTAELTRAIGVALPIGSTPAQVVAFLDGRKLGHSEFDAKTRSLYASTAEEQVNFLIRTRVLIEFHFDEMERMTSFSVQQGVTGL